MNTADYTRADLRRVYSKLLSHQPAVVMVRADLRWLGRYESLSKKELLEAHYGTLKELLDSWGGTLVVSTASLSLCNTDRVFDPVSTPSEMGILSEYVRTQSAAVRSFHPFVSYTAIGPLAEEICGNVARHAFGPHTPKARMIDRDACCLSIGSHPRFTCSTIHQVEIMMSVPYRYVKEFLHPVKRGNTISREEFYLYVLYRECDAKRDRNKKLFQYLDKRGFCMQSYEVGRGKVHAYSIRQFYEMAMMAMKEDIYIWLEGAPVIRPYQR